MQISMELFIAVLILAASAAILLLWTAVLFLLSFIGGWKRLAGTFRTELKPSGDSFSAASGCMRVVNYSFVLNAAVSSEGLFLSVLKPFRPFHPGLFIPWSSIVSLKHKSLLFNRFIEIGIKDSKGVFHFTLSDKVLTSRNWPIRPGNV